MISWELLCPEGELLSDRVDTMLEKPATRVAAIAAVGATALHLLNVFDAMGATQLDPYHQVGKLGKYVKKRTPQIDG
ncbi:hypothetical protein GCM10009570_24820 [Dietzia natronolimnaea]|nr:hypothetical protein [Dietzia natronolimnaea]MBB1037414.1 hypothetical protein [Dietzia natronolimnaea]